MISKHTPGPWSLNKATMAVGLIGWHVAGNDDGSVAPIAISSGIFDLFRSRETEEANARLIAAAPDLLAVLEKIAAISEFDTSSMGYVVGLSKAAIAKATGSGS